MSEIVVNNKKAYTEVYKVLINLSENELKKIPISLMQGLKSNMDLQYNFEFDIYKPLEYQNLSHKAKLMLAVIFRDYLATEKQKEKILIFEKNKELELEEIARKQYDVDVFKNKREVKLEKNVEETVQKETKLIKVEQEKWYIKLYNALKNLIKRLK